MGLTAHLVEEGAAEFLALYLADQKGWLSFRQRMDEALNESLELRSLIPNLTIADIAADRDRVSAYCGLCFGTLQYATGQWATAWLANRTSVDAVFLEFFPMVYDQGIDQAFETTFGLTIDDFMDEFEEFMKLPRQEQLGYSQLLFPPDETEQGSKNRDTTGFCDQSVRISFRYSWDKVLPERPNDVKRFLADETGLATISTVQADGSALQHRKLWGNRAPSHRSRLRCTGLHGVSWPLETCASGVRSHDSYQTRLELGSSNRQSRPHRARRPTTQLRFGEASPTPARNLFSGRRPT